MKKLVTLLMAVGMMITSFTACGNSKNETNNDSQINDNTFVYTTEEKSYGYWYDYQRDVDSRYADIGWYVLEPGIYLEPITHQIDVWGGDSGIIYNVLMPAVYDTELWMIYYNDYNYEYLFVEYDTMEFAIVQDKVMKAWNNYMSGNVFKMTDESYDNWYTSNASNYDTWNWAKSYLR